MAATLSAGVGSLILKLDQPYDRVRTTDARDDLQKLRIWCSTTSDFTPSDSNKVFDALSLSVVIAKITTDGTTFTSLVAGTTYYVKYAFISTIDDVSSTAYTISSELSAIPIIASAQTVDISGYTAFVKNSAGTTLTPTTVTLTAVLNGITSPQYTWTITGGTLSTTDTVSTIVTPTISSTSVTVTLSVTGTGITTPIVKTIVMAIVNDGQNATAYGLVVSAGAIQKTKAGVLNPTTITVYGYFAVGVTTPGLYAGRFKIYENGSATASYTSAANESSYTYTPSSASITSLKAELYLAGATTSKLDEQSIPVIVDGTDTITAVLSNESATVPADNAGTVATFAGAETTMSVFVGATDDSANWTFAATKTNITSTASGTPVNRTQTVTALSALSGYIDITASKAGYSSITKRFNVNKSLNGTSSLVYDIVTSAPVIVKDAVDAATTGTYTSITVQGKKYDGNTTANYGWVTVTANGDAEAATAIDTSSAVYTLSPASTSGKSSYNIQLYNQATVSGATLLDTQFIAVVYKGAPGAAGNSAINAILSNGVHTFPADKDGNVSSYTNSGTQLRIYEGATELAYDGTGTSNSTWTFSTSPTNITVGTVTDSGTYATIGAHSGVLAGNDSSAITYNITGKSSTGVAFSTTQTQTFSKSKAGQNSTVAGASNHRAYRSFATGSPPATAPDSTTNGAAPTTRGGTAEVWSLTPVSISEGNAQYQTDGITAAGSTTTTWSVPYLSYFKVGNLQAVSANTGTLTVTGTITVSDDTSGAVLITTSGMSIYSGPSTARVLRVKLGNI
jgi:hypothetical protein